MLRRRNNGQVAVDLRVTLRATFGVLSSSSPSPTPPRSTTPSSVNWRRPLLADSASRARHVYVPAAPTRSCRDVLPFFRLCPLRPSCVQSNRASHWSYPHRNVGGSVSPTAPNRGSMSDVTRILSEIEQGDPSAAEHLLPLVYDELRKLAVAKMAHERPGQTLQATALVHEAYVRLVDRTTPQQWDNRRHFFSAAAEAMRRILIERARQKQSLKRGGDQQRVDLESIEPAVLPMACDDLLGLDEALERLERDHPRKAQLVKLRFFAGLTTSQAADTLGISISSAENDWTYARSWLRLAMSGNG